MDNETLSVPQTTQAAQVTPTHTPGPLSVGYYHPSPSFLSAREHIAVMDENEGLVAITGYSYTDEDPEIVARNIADARLLAAAPDLLAACESSLWLIIELDASGSAQWEVKDQLRAVIARAKGETDARDNS